MVKWIILDTFQQIHSEFDKQFPLRSENRICECSDLKSELNIKKYFSIFLTGSEFINLPRYDSCRGIGQVIQMLHYIFSSHLN